MSTASGVPEANAPARRSDVQIVRYEKYIDNELRKTRRQVRMVDLTWGGMALLTGALAYLFVIALVDQWVVSGGLGHGARAVALFLFLAGAIGWIAWAVAPLLFRRINPIYAANAIEQARPTLKNGLVNFMMLRGHPESISPAVFAQIEKQAAQGLSQAPLENTVDRSHLLKLAYVLLGIVAVLAIYKVASPKDPIRSVRRVLAPWADIAAPTRVRINSVDPGEASAFHGRFVKVSAEISGLRRDEAPQIFFSTTDGQVVGQSISMSVPPGELRFVAELPPSQGGLQQDMEYWIVAGDATSVHYPIHVLTTPSIVVEKIEVRPPNYTGLEWYTVERQGDIAAIEGTEVVIHGTANEDIKTAAIDFDCNGSRDVQMQIDGRQATVKFPLALKKNGEGEHASYQLRFTNIDGEENPEPVRYKIEVTPDRAPEIVFTAPITKDDEIQTIQPNELLNLVVQAADPDFKLKDVKVVIERNALPLAANSLLPAADSKFKGPYLLDGKALKLKAGDKLEYWAEAIDNKLPNPNRTLTSKRQLRVAALDPQRNNREKQPGGRGDGEDADPRGGENPNRDPQQNPKADPKNQRDPNPRRNPDRTKENEQANDRPPEQRPGEDAIPPRDNVDDPRDPERDKPPENPKKPGETNKDNRAKPDRDPSNEQQNDPAQPNQPDAADQPMPSPDKAKQEQDKAVDGNSDPGSVIKKALEKRAKELEKQNPSQQNPQKDSPQKDPKQDPDQPDQNQADPKKQQNDETEKPKPNKPPKKEKSEESQGDSSGGAGESQGNEKGDGDSDGKGEAGEQGASGTKPNPNQTQKSESGDGEANDGNDPAKGNDPNQTGQPKPNDKGARGKNPADQNKGDGSKGDAGNKGGNDDQPKEGKNDGAGKPDKNNPGGKGNAAKPDKNRDPDGAGANGEKPEGAKPGANEKPNDKPGANNERGPKADPAAKPAGKDPQQNENPGDELNPSGKPNDEGKKPGDPQKTGERTKGEQQGTGKEGAADDSPDGQKGPETQNPGDPNAGGKNSKDPTKKPPRPEKGVGQGASSGKPGEKPEGDNTQPDDDSESADKADPNAKKVNKAPKSAANAKFEDDPKDADQNDPNAPADANKPDNAGGKPKQQSGEKSQQPQPGENPQPGQRGNPEKQPGAKPQPGQQQQGDKPDNKDPGSAGQQPSEKPGGAKDKGQEQQGSSGSPNSKQGNNQPGGEKPSSQATPQAKQDANKPAEQAGADSDSKNSETDQEKAPSDSNKQSKTKGQQDGDRDGAGGAGGGQKSNSPGQGSPGQNTDAQEGGGRSNQSGDGETANRPGDKKPGTAEQGAKPSGKPGEGSTTRPGEQKQAGQTTAQRNQPGGQGAGNGEAQQGPAPGNPTGGSGLASGTKAADNPPSEQRQNTPTEDEANLEYAKKQTDLALEYLKDQLAKGKPDQELLDELKWSRDDMENFVKQWERFKKQANAGDPAERKQFEQRLEDLGLRPKSTNIKGGAAQEHRNQVLRDSKRSEPPSEYGGQWRAFNGGAAKSRQGK